MAEDAVGVRERDVEAQLVGVVGVLGGEVHAVGRDVRVEEVRRGVLRVGQRRAVQRGGVADDAVVALVGDEADVRVDGPGGGVRKPETGMSVGPAVAVIVFEPVEDRQVARGLGRVAVGDDQRPAGVVVGALAGLDVGDGVRAVAGGGDAARDVREGLVAADVGGRVVERRGGDVG